MDAVNRKGGCDMAIETAHVMQQIEKHLSQAKTADPAKQRESIAAIRALCELVLDDSGKVASAPRTLPLSAPAPAPVTSLNKLEEDDANKDSIFEF